MTTTAVTTESRFWPKVAVATGDECWEWQAGRDRKGYGNFSRYGQKRIRAHRFAWEIANGPVPEGLSVLHRCDNPPCVKVGHLFVGTTAENHADRDAKGRQARGARNGRARLTDTAVLEIRNSEGVGSVALARKFGVSPVTVRRVWRGTTWATA